MIKPILFATAAVGLMAVAACSPKSSTSETTTSTTTESAAPTMTATEASQVMAQSIDPAAYIGKWTGPEGTSLVIKPKSGGYDVVITNLDGPRTFTGELQPDGLHVTRDGTLLVIHPGSGDDTGMKWLAGKTDCLVVAANEGYCRN